MSEPSGLSQQLENQGLAEEPQITPDTSTQVEKPASKKKKKKKKKK
jgi:hypothetical protein